MLVGAAIAVSYQASLREASNPSGKFQEFVFGAWIETFFISYLFFYKDFIFSFESKTERAQAGRQGEAGPPLSREPDMTAGPGNHDLG